MALLASDGGAVVQYGYDAWGRLNPFRYRGCVFDEETGLYYVCSRYYHSEYCRWMNADVAAVSYRVSTGSWNGAGEAALDGMGDGALSGAVTGAVSGGASAGLRYGTFPSKSELTEHFAKHGKEFGGMYTNAKEYAKGAKYVIKNGTYIPEKNAYIRFWGTGRRAEYAFVGMKAGGRVSTYHIRPVAKMIRSGVSMFY